MFLKAIFRRIIALLAGVNGPVSVSARNLAAGFLAAMTVIVLMQVFFRYVLNNSLTWTEEVAKIMMVWSAFLVAPWAYRMGANVSIDMLAAALSRGARLLLRLALNLLILWIVAIFFAESLEFWERGLTVRAATMPVQMAWFYSVVPFGFAGLFLVGVELFFRDLMALVDPGGDYAVPGTGEAEQAAEGTS